MASPPVGYSYESDYFNTISQGIVGNRLIIETRSSGTGKTRSAINRLVRLCSPFLWNHKTKQFEPNKNGQGHSGLYLGSEMSLKLEIQPMIVSFIAGVSEKKLRAKTLNEDEKQRIEQAMEYSKQAKIFQENNPDFTIRWIEQTVEKYKRDYNIKLVCLDYIELTPFLAQEYAEQMVGVHPREDIVLLNFSKCMKERVCKPYDITMIAYTQTNVEGNSGARDSTAIKGSKALINKADLGLTVFRPTPKELKILEPIIMEKSKGFGRKLIPNICYSAYKMRWFSFTSEEGNKVPYTMIKIWGIQGLGDGNFIDCFVTNEQYELIDLPKTKININLENKGEDN